MWHYTSVCGTIPRFVALYLCLWHYTSVCGNIPRFVAIYLGLWHYTSVCGNIPRFVALYLGLWHYTSVCGTIPRFRYDRVVWVICCLLFLFYSKEMDNLIIRSSKVRFPESGLFYKLSSRNTQNVSVLY